MFAVAGFVHVNVLHDRRALSDTHEISTLRSDRYLIVMLLGCLMWSASYLNLC
jgi:hypothetical protein